MAAAVQYDGRTGLRVGKPRLAFTIDGLLEFEVMPDGSGFVGRVIGGSGGIVTELELVTNWFEELRGSTERE